MEVWISNHLELAGVDIGDDLRLSLLATPAGEANHAKMKSIISGRFAE